MDYSVFADFCRELGLEVKTNEPMKGRNGFKTGGNADIFLCVNSEEELSCLLETANALKVPVFVLGKGSNLLVSDDGIEGAVICLNGLDGISISGNEITAGAGASLTAVCVEACKNSLSGLEFAYGIPGTVGGGLFMNAGAYGGEMADVVISARYVIENGEKGEISADKMELGYRTSCFKKNGNIITSVTFRLIPSDKALIKQKMDCLMEKRKLKQPLEYPSAGSTFKRPEGYFAGALIEENGLKGFSVGGAQVSEKHAGFVINRCGATTKDIMTLMERVQATVLKNNGVRLEPEVIFVGRK